MNFAHSDEWVSHMGYIIAGEPLSRRKRRFLKAVIALTPVSNSITGLFYLS
jgi:hypothetical protein